MNFIEIFQDLPRQGPGDNQSTQKAFAKVNISDGNLLDIGCGSGAQTLQLARMFDGKICALDYYKPFLERLICNAEKENLHTKISTLIASMDNLPFEIENFDVIWAEGAIFIIGFENGLRYWKDFLKPNGYMVVSEISWLKDNPPQEIIQFWQKQEVVIHTINENVIICRAQNFIIIDTFILPETSWWENFYIPMMNRVEDLLIKYKHDNEAIKILEETLSEIDYFSRFSEYYGQVFYILQKKV